VAFAYYKKLSKANQAIYRKSDRIELVPIVDVELLYIKVTSLRQALEAEDRRLTEKVASEIINAIATNISAPLLAVRVLSSR
jgi:hypothetical protein